MPADLNLKYVELRDFSAGLWTVNDQLLPPNGAVTMTDCYATPAGGLRSWYKPTTVTTTGISSTTNEAPRCIFAHSDVDGAGNDDNYLITYNATDTFCRLYRMDQSASQTTWTLVHTFVGGLDPGPITCCALNLSNGDLLFVWSFGANAQGTDHGTWYLRHGDGALSHITTIGGFVAAYQSRLLIANGSSIAYSDPGALTNITVNTAPVDISEGQPQIVMMATFSPGDLLVFKEGAPIYLVEGDLFNYTVRQMNGSKPAQIGGMNVVRGPNGILFRAGSDGVYETPDGSTLLAKSLNISSQSWITNEPMVFSHHFLMSFQNGLVLDYDTGCWFTTSALPSTHGAAYRLPRLGGVLFTDNSSPFTIWRIIPADGRTDNRMETYTWKSGPLRDPTGRQIEVRSVEIYARSTNGATSTIAVTVNGVTNTLACDSSGRGGLTYYFLQRREDLDVQVVAASNQVGTEAPRIEVVRVGTRTGHFLTDAADAG